MPDHVHDFRFLRKVWKYEIGATCIECGEKLSWAEVERRLNATEKLKATQAQLYSEHIIEDPPFLLDECSGDLSAYAAALEGENEKS